MNKRAQRPFFRASVKTELPVAPRMRPSEEMEEFKAIIYSLAMTAQLTLEDLAAIFAAWGLDGKPPMGQISPMILAKLELYLLRMAAESSSKNI